MSLHPEHQVTDVELLKEGVMVWFQDDTCAIFSGPLLYSVLPQARVIDEESLARE